MFSGNDLLPIFTDCILSELYNQTYLFRFDLSFSLISPFTLITMFTAVVCIKTTKISPNPIHRPPIGSSAHRSLTNCIFQSLQRLLFFFFRLQLPQPLKEALLKLLKGQTDLPIAFLIAHFSWWALTRHCIVSLQKEYLSMTRAFTWVLQ